MSSRSQCRHQAQLLPMLHRIYPVRYLPRFAQLIQVLVLELCLLLGALFPPQAPHTEHLCATGRKQIFVLRLTESVKKAQEAQLVSGHAPRHNLSPRLPAPASKCSAPQLRSALRLPVTTLAQGEDTHMARGRHRVQYCHRRLTVKQQQHQRYQTRSFLPPLQPHTKAGLWATQ